MSAALIWRLVWKDFRMLLPALLAVLGLAVMLQLWCVILGLLDQMPADMGNMLACVVGCFFPLAVAVGAIQFAGEVEDDTLNWLRQLPISSWLLATVKLLTPVVVFLFYVVAGTLTGLILSRFRWPNAVVLSELVSAIVPFLGLFACTAFFSLQMKKVVPAAAVGLLCAALLTIQVFMPLAPTGAVGLPTLTYRTFTLLAVDFALAVRWAQGRSVRPTLSWLRGSRAFELPDVWQPLLQWTAARRDPVLRTTAALAWRELRGISVFILIWGLAGWVFVNGALMALPELSGIAVWYMLLTPLFAGVFAYMNDQSRESQLFIGHRGISPSLVWITRNSLWFSATLVLVLGWSLWDRYGLHPNEVPKEGSKYVHQSVFQIVDQVRVHYPVMEMRPYPPATAQDVALQASLIGSLLLGFFALGGVCGMWTQRPVTAILAAFVFGLILFLWHLLALAAAVPLWLTTWPLAILWLVATWSGCGRWLTARSLPWRKQCAWLFLPILLVIPALPIARYYQIPRVNVSLDVVEARHAAFSRGQPQEWEKLREIVRERRESFPLVTWTPELTQAYLAQLHKIASMDPGRWSLTPEQRVGSRDLRAFVVGVASGGYSETLRSEGRFREEMTLYLDSLGVIERIPPMQIYDAPSLCRDQISLLQHIARCANDPECDLETLQFALKTLGMNSDLLRARLVRVEYFDALMAEAREAEVVVARQLLHQEGDYYELFLQNPFQRVFNVDESEEEEPPPQWLRSLYYWSGEHARYDRLAAAVLAEPEWGSPVTSEDVLRWWQVTPRLTESGYELGIGEELQWRLWGDFANRQDGRRLYESAYHPAERELPSLYRMTLLTVALQIYRRERGEFPESLSELRTNWDPEFDVPSDPYARSFENGPEGDFLWYPHGLDAVYVSTFGPIVQAGQPLLLSVGFGRWTLRFEGPFDNPTAEGVASAGVYVDGSGFNNSPKIKETSSDHPPPLLYTIDAGPSDVVAAAILGGSCFGGTTLHYRPLAEDEADE